VKRIALATIVCMMLPAMSMAGESQDADIPCHGYVCGNQGITSGWADLYSKNLSGQWIDITGVPDGDYICAWRSTRHTHSPRTRTCTMTSSRWGSASDPGGPP
jgi:hypothetical protein